MNLNRTDGQILLQPCSSETDLSWYGILLWFKHTNNLAHLRSLVRIGVNTSQSSQKGSFKRSCWWPGFNVWVHHFLRPPASNHHFQPINQIYLQAIYGSCSMRLQNCDFWHLIARTQYTNQYNFLTKFLQIRYPRPTEEHSWSKKKL